MMRGVMRGVVGQVGPGFGFLCDFDERIGGTPARLNWRLMAVNHLELAV